MSNYNNYQDGDNQFVYGNTSRNVFPETQTPTPQPVQRTKKSNSGLKLLGTILISGLVGLAAGFGGASFALKNYEPAPVEPTVIYQEVQAPTTQPTNVSTNIVARNENK